MDIVTKEPFSVVVGITLIKVSLTVPCVVGYSSCDTLHTYTHTFTQRNNEPKGFFNIYGIHSNRFSSGFKWDNIIGKLYGSHGCGLEESHMVSCP